MLTQLRPMLLKILFTNTIYLRPTRNFWIYDTCDLTWGQQRSEDKEVKEPFWITGIFTYPKWRTQAQLILTQECVTLLILSWLVLEQMKYIKDLYKTKLFKTETTCKGRKTNANYVYCKQNLYAFSFEFPGNQYKKDKTGYVYHS